MKTKFILLLFVVAVFGFMGSGVAAQVIKKETAKTMTVQNKNKISAADQKAIRELFQCVDPKEYRLEFDNGRDVIGNKPISMTELRQINKVRNPVDDKASIVFVTRDDGVMYVFASTKSKLTTLLGQEKMTKLNAIMAKYQ